MKHALWLLALLLLAVPAPAARAQTGDGSGPQGQYPDVRAHLEPELLRRLLASDGTESLPLIVRLRDQLADAAAPALAGEKSDRSALVTGLQEAAERSQAAVLAFLTEEQAAGRAGAVRSFWIFDGLSLTAQPQTIWALAARPDVALVESDHYAFRLDPGEATTNAAAPSSSPAWGIQRVRADLVWAAFGDTGQGVVVANMDTGVDFLHPALMANYRGNLGRGLYQHAGNWYDATGAGTEYPYDGFGHGTHTMGTLAGSDGIGMAPGSRWIAARILNGQGYGYDSWIHAGFQWILAPGGDASLAPDVLSNSWGSTLSGSTEFAADLARLRQAGIVVVFSAGNAGPEAGTVGSPASLPGGFAVGATDGDDEVASFSGRGPSPWGGVKPQVAGPGVNVLSSVPGGTYALASGTSMSAPHVAGVAALVLSIRPGMSVTATEYALTSTAHALASPLPNNDSGWGRIDAYNAVQSVSGSGVLSGKVRDAASLLPLPGAMVAAHNFDTGSDITVRADAGGAYSAGLAAGPYRVTASHFGYQSEVISLVPVITGTTTVCDLAPEPLPLGVVLGVLTDTVGYLPVTATVSALGSPLSQTGYGQYQLALPAGTYTLQAKELGYRVMTATVTVAAGEVTRRDFGLEPTPRILLVNSGAWYYQEYPSYYRQALDDLGYSYDERRIKHVPADVPAAADLQPYDVVVWSAPQDSPGLIGAQAAITGFLSAGGSLLLSGQDVAFWDGGGSMLTYASYLNSYLKTGYAGENSIPAPVKGIAGQVMAGLSFAITGGTGANNQSGPDLIAIADPDSAAGVFGYLNGGLAGDEAGLCLPYRTVFLPYGYEAIADAASRKEVMRRALAYFAGPRQAAGYSVSLSSPQIRVGLPGQELTYTLRLRNAGEIGGPAGFTIRLESSGWEGSVSDSATTAPSCASTSITLTTRIPAGLPLNSASVFTVTVEPADHALPAQAITLTAKTPAPVLLVDHDRWFDVRGTYQQALGQAGVAYDFWDASPQSDGRAHGGPPVSVLRQYAAVVWFTGYDWYSPVSAGEEIQLGEYLDNGGRLLLSSAFYLAGRGDSVFTRDRLGITAYTHGAVATRTYGSPGHPAGAGFGPLTLTEPFPGASASTLDGALAPVPTAATAFRGDQNRAQSIAAAVRAARTVFWGIPLEALPAPARPGVIPRSLGWLGRLGDSTVGVDPPVLAPGQAATVTITLRNNGLTEGAAITASLPSGLSLDPAFPDLPGQMTYDPFSRTVLWHGTAPASAPITFTLHLRAEGAAASRSEGSVVFYDEGWGLTFDQPLVAAVNAPDLAHSDLRVSERGAGGATTVEMVALNSGLSGAAAASVAGLAPLGSRILTGTLAVQGPGAITAGLTGFLWQGPLGAGQRITLTYQISTPRSFRPANPPVEMLAWDGQGSAWEWRLGLADHLKAVFLPLLTK